MSMSADDAIALARLILAQESLATHASGTGQRPPRGLTVREREVLRLMADGLGDKSIATTLGMSQRTASHHVGVILNKLGAESRTAAVSQAFRQGLLEVSPPLDSHGEIFPPA